MELLEGLAGNFVSGDYRLLIVDSIMALFRADFSGRAELSERQQALQQFLIRLNKMASEFNIAIFMVRDQPRFFWTILIDCRQTRSNRTQVLVPYSQVLMVASRSGAMYSRMPLQPDFCFAKVGAKSVLQRSWILQVKFPYSYNKQHWLTSSDCPERESIYVITNGGINDPEKVWFENMNGKDLCLHIALRHKMDYTALKVAGDGWSVEINTLGVVLYL